MRAPYQSQDGDAVMKAIVKARSGSVLGKGFILKMYFFPGQRTSSHIQIHGAPHVYKVRLQACVSKILMVNMLSFHMVRPHSSISKVIYGEIPLSFQ